MASELSSATAPPVPVTARIPRVEATRGLLGAAGPSVYVVEVEAFGVSSEVKHTFEDFELLHGDLSHFIKSLPSQVRMKVNFAIPQLPASSWLDKIGQDFAKNIDERRLQLEELLQKLLLQAVVVGDSECRLWRFLKLHPAASAAARLLTSRTCGPWLRNLWEASIQNEGLLVLHHPSVEAALLELVAEAVAKKEVVQMHDQLVLICELLQRTFLATEADSAREDNTKARGRVLLMLLIESHSDCWILRDVVSRCLLAVTRSDAWSRALPELTEESNILDSLGSLSEEVGNAFGSLKLDEVTASNAARCLQRCIAELILRGFDGCFVRTFLEPSNADARKQLLNAFFASSDLFVRLVAGLLLARLITEPSYAEVQTAELGLISLSKKLASAEAPDLKELKLGELLHEDHLWYWFCELIMASDPTVSRYAVLLLVLSVKPSASRLLSKAGLIHALSGLLLPDTDEFIKSLVARMLLDAYREKVEETPSDADHMTSLCTALHVSLEALVESRQPQREKLAVGIDSCRQRHEVIAAVDQLMINVRNAAANLDVQTDVWRTAFEEADVRTSTAEDCRDECNASVVAVQSAIGSAVSNTKASIAESRRSENNASSDLLQADQELAEDEASVEASTMALEALLREKMSIVQEVSDCDEEAQKWRAAASQALEREGRAAVAKDEAVVQSAEGDDDAPNAHECCQRHQEALLRMKSLRLRLEELDVEMQSLASFLPEQKEALHTKRTKVEKLRAQGISVKKLHSAVLEQWSSIFSAADVCDTKLEDVAARLEETRSGFQAERERRQALREAICGMMESLTALDQQLEHLESEDTPHTELGTEQTSSL